MRCPSTVERVRQATTYVPLDRVLSATRIAVGFARSTSLREATTLMPAASSTSMLLNACTRVSENSM